MSGDALPWAQVWQTRSAEEVSWFQPSADTSLEIIESASTPTSAVIDVGGGASTVVDGLLARGYRDLTVLDLAPAALDASRARLGADAERVTWLVGDITSVELGRQFDVWHDRAVFHFFVDDADRQRYLDALRRWVAVGGTVVLATFALDGPTMCSGRQVRRYDADAMRAALGEDFEATAFVEEAHHTPSGATQQFLYGRFTRLR